EARSAGQVSNPCAMIVPCLYTPSEGWKSLTKRTPWLTTHKALPLSTACGSVPPAGISSLTHSSPFSRHIAPSGALLRVVLTVTQGHVTSRASSTQSEVQVPGAADCVC